MVNNNFLCTSGDTNRYWCNRGLGLWEQCTCKTFVANHVWGPRRHMVFPLEDKKDLLEYYRVNSLAEMPREVKVSIGVTGGSNETLKTGRSYYDMGGNLQTKLEWLPFSLGRAGRVGASLLTDSVRFHTAGKNHHGYLARPGATWEFPLISDVANFGWTVDLGAHGGLPLNLPDDRALYSATAGLNLYFFKYPAFQPIFSFRVQYLTRDSLDQNDLVTAFHAGIGL